MFNKFIRKALALTVIFLFSWINIIPTMQSNIISISNLDHINNYKNIYLNKIKRFDKIQHWNNSCDNNSINYTKMYPLITNRMFSFVIIANETFYEYNGSWDLKRLADWHNKNDTISAFITNLSEIYLNNTFWVNGTWGDGNPDNPFKRNDENTITKYNLFNDSQAKIRNYLRYAYVNHNVRYALLVGDADDSNPMFPIRECYSRGDGAPLGTVGPQYELIPTDMYYACLNGTFNADEDINSENSRSGFGENATESAKNIDECDWEHEIAVGRFPVDDTTELSHIIQKTIAYMNLNGDEEYLQNITLAGHGGGFGGITEWMCNYSKILNGTTYNSWKDGYTTHGFNANNWRIKIIDANPNREEGEPFYDANSRGDFNNGVHIFYESSHGSTSGWHANGGEGHSFTISDIQALTNTNYCFVMSAMPCNTATFDESSDPFGEQFVTDEYGAFAYLGNTRYGYGSYEADGLNSTSHRLGAEIIDALFNTSEGYTRIGDMVWDSKKDVRHWHDDLGDQAIRYAMYEQILFGSPAVLLHGINDSIPPEISKVQANPSEQDTGGYVNISATVIDNIKVDDVFLTVEYPNSNIKNFSISQNKTGNIYYCNKTYGQVGIYTYHIWANDTNRNQNISIDYNFKIIKNQAPYTPNDPQPSDGATDVDINADLSWNCSDPDGDDLTYDVYFEADDSTPDVLVSSNQSEKWYDPGEMDYNTHYYWQIVAWDEYGEATSGPIWDFTTGSLPNDPPYQPSNPNPENGSINININVNLSWSGGDPDPEDTVVYDIYFEANDSTPDILVSNDQPELTYAPGTLNFNTIYYWRIIAKDNHKASTTGPIWHFTTNKKLVPDLMCDGNLGWNDVEPGSTIDGSFTVSNVGDKLSLLDWEITDWPNWGNWVFKPKSGDGLKPSDGPFTVNISITIPNQKNTELVGDIQIVNKENTSDSCKVSVYIKTPKTKSLNIGLQFLRSLKKNPILYPAIMKLL